MGSLASDVANGMQISRRNITVSLILQVPSGKCHHSWCQCHCRNYIVAAMHVAGDLKEGRLALADLVPFPTHIMLLVGAVIALAAIVAAVLGALTAGTVVIPAWQRCWHWDGCSSVQEYCVTTMCFPERRFDIMEERSCSQNTRVRTLISRSLAS